MSEEITRNCFPHNICLSKLKIRAEIDRLQTTIDFICVLTYRDEVNVPVRWGHLTGVHLHCSRTRRDIQRVKAFRTTCMRKLRVLNLSNHDFGLPRGCVVNMSPNLSPNFNYDENLGKINVLSLYYIKLWKEVLGSCVGDWCDFPHEAISVFPSAL